MHVSPQTAECESLNPGIANPQQRAFLAAFRESGNVRLSCKVANVGRSSHYRWLKDPVYREALELAKEDAADLLEAEVRRRAVEGVEKPTGWYQGRPGGYIREYSDLLLIFYLKAIRPEKYRDRVEVRGVLSSIDYTRFSDEQLQRVVDGEDPRAVLASDFARLQQAAPVGLLPAGPATAVHGTETEAP